MLAWLCQRLDHSQANGCKISSDRKTLKALDVAKALITIIRLAVSCFIQAVALCQGYMSRLIMFITTVKKKQFVVVKRHHKIR